MSVLVEDNANTSGFLKEARAVSARTSEALLRMVEESTSYTGLGDVRRALTDSQKQAVRALVIVGRATWAEEGSTFITHDV